MSDDKDRILAKIQKLLAMGNDGRGNANEAETALRQAAALMTKHGIEQAEVDMSSLRGANVEFGEAWCRPDVKQSGQGYSRVATWAGILAYGVAIFTDTKSQGSWGPSHAAGVGITFQGLKEDVAMARWLFIYFMERVYSEQRADGIKGRGEAQDYKFAACIRLQFRLKELYAERQAAFKAAREAGNSNGGTALVVVDTKLALVREKFGASSVKQTSREYKDPSAAILGAAAGNRIKIDQNRPLAGTSTTKIGANL